MEVQGVQYDSTQMQILTSYRGSDRYPKWSPDGSSIAFISDRDYVSTDTLRFRRDLYIRNSDGTNLERVTNFGFPGSYAWMNSNKLILTKTDINTKLKDIFIKNIITSKTTFLMKDLKVKPQLWIFGNPVKNQLFTINKSHNEIPIIIAVYNKNGKLISQHKVTSSILKTALGFDWHISKEKN